MSKNEKRPLPVFQADEEAERFVDEADLSLYDLHTNRRTMTFSISSAEAEVFRDTDGQFRIRVTEPTGRVRIMPVGYADEKSARDAANSIGDLQPELPKAAVRK
jgi:uncharacterized protein YegP (UPF0339 family)